MPNRILKDSICTSPNIDQLSRNAEVFFYRLIVQCDDFGRMDARLPILRAKCYPLQIDQVSQDDIKAWLAELVKAELVILYTVNGTDYLQMRTWERHQQVRAKRSKYPEMQSSEINCDQVQSDAPVIQSNPNPKEGESNSEPPPPSEKTFSERNSNGYFGMPVPHKREKVVADGYTQDAAKENVNQETYRAIVDTLIDAAGWKALIDVGDDTKLNYAKADALTLIRLGNTTIDHITKLTDAYRKANAWRGGAVTPRQLAEYASQLKAGVQNTNAVATRVTAEVEEKLKADARAAKSRIATAQKLGYQPTERDTKIVESYYGAKH